MREQVRDAFDWQGLRIEVLFFPDWSPAYRAVYGYALARLEIEADGPLPITETGFMGRFDRADNIDAEGGPVAYVRAWLDHAASSPEWLERQAAARQLSMF